VSDFELSFPNRDERSVVVRGRERGKGSKDSLAPACF